MKKTMIIIKSIIGSIFCGVGGISLLANAAGVPTLNEVTVRANTKQLIGTANSANEGTVLKQQLDSRTVYRPGELLASVPGLIVTQHSGAGKAHQ